MARIRNDQLSEEEKKIISKRLTNVFEDQKNKNPKLTKKEIAESIGVSQSTISRVFDGESLDNFITLKRLMSLSKYFNVNMDYLTGLSKSKKALNTESRLIADNLNLSDKAIENIKSLSKLKNDDCINAFNKLLESQFFTTLIAYLKYYFYSESDLTGYIFHTDPNNCDDSKIKINNKLIDIVLLEHLKDLIKEIKKEDSNNGKK